MRTVKLRDRLQIVHPDHVTETIDIIKYRRLRMDSFCELTKMGFAEIHPYHWLKLRVW